MREIKFRAFDEKRKEMLYNVWPFASLAHVTKGISFDFETMRAESKILDIHIDNLMQYTGLKDKNGTDIYDGDILKDETTYPLEVYWNNKKATFFLKWNDNNGDEQMPIYYMDDEDDSFESLEVIGNIYENHELLKETE